MTLAENKTAVLTFFTELQGFTLSDVMKEIGLSEKTFNNRLESWCWTVSEICKIQQFLKMDYAVSNKLFFNAA